MTNTLCWFVALANEAIQERQGGFRPQRGFANVRSRNRSHKGHGVLWFRVNYFMYYEEHGVAKSTLRDAWVPTSELTPTRASKRGETAETGHCHGEDLL